MGYLVRAFPLIRPVEELQAFLAALKAEKSADAARFYGQYGVTQEIAYLQDLGPGKKILIVVTVLSDAKEAAPRYAAASEGFHAWFKQQILHLTGVDPNVAPLGPPTTEVFNWRAE
ncbi:hypothetical protein HLB44_25095 [Aquincola sp. S2]|uniref:NIPSNAP domain-containing protein n=1 Tax=Pseudaquabacterium terrae TaxID=2732868 RepID=A0ABX2ENK8_9BURK|nr:hypothetical protein [Aquabacterium terrae]NRF70290.1 hypothetical protein [Aquabacterium terrae]